MARVSVPVALATARVRPGHGLPVRLTGPTMGVTWTVDALLPDGVSGPPLAAQVQGVVDGVVAQMSQWEPISDLSRFNAAPAGWVDVPPGLLHVVGAGLALAEASDGAFDPTLGRLTDLWGFGPTGAAASPPPAEAITAAVTGWENLEIDAGGGRMRQPGGLALDLSGIAKGYGIDAVARRLATLGIRDFLVEIGGELRGGGVKASGEPWFVEIERPPGLSCDDEPILVALHDLSIATSGEWRRSFVHDGRRYGPTLDPRTRRPLSGAVDSVAVLHAECMQADALCTAMAAMGPERGLAYADSGGLAVLFMLREGERLVERMSRAFAATLD